MIFCSWTDLLFSTLELLENCRNDQRVEILVDLRFEDFINLNRSFAIWQIYVFNLNKISLILRESL